jgi:hypothetical protein
MSKDAACAWYIASKAEKVLLLGSASGTMSTSTQFLNVSCRWKSRSPTPTPMQLRMGLRFTASTGEGIAGYGRQPSSRSGTSLAGHFDNIVIIRK